MTIYGLTFTFKKLNIESFIKNLKNVKRIDEHWFIGNDFFVRQWARRFKVRSVILPDHLIFDDLPIDFFIENVAFQNKCDDEDIIVFQKDVLPLVDPKKIEEGIDLILQRKFHSFCSDNDSLYIFKIRNYFELGNKMYGRTKII